MSTLIARPESKGAALPVVVGISASCVFLVSVISVRYAHDRPSAIECGIFLAIMVAVTAVLDQLRRGSFGREYLKAVASSTGVGALLGVLWICEIALNNIVAPLEPARLRWDNLFFAVIAFSMLVYAAVGSHRERSVSQGLCVGSWLGAISGLVACWAALVLVVFGMRFLLADPYNVIEFAQRGEHEPDMATYLAFETMPGAFAHLFLPGLTMGSVLGIAGGGIGKAARLIFAFLE